MDEATTGKGANWKPALLLAAASAVAGALLVPYVRELLPATRTVSLVRLAVSSALEMAIMAFFAAWAGLSLGRAIGLDAPWLRALVDRHGPPATRGRFLAAAVVGVVAGALIVALDATLFASAHPAATAAAPIARWRGLCGSFYGGIVEEILLRLLVMTAIARLAMLVARTRTLSPPIAWSAIVLASLIFGAAHLHTAAQLGPLTPSVVARVILLNSIGGVAYGWLYWRRGLEHAMVAHFASDLVLHVLVGG